MSASIKAREMDNAVRLFDQIRRKTGVIRPHVFNSMIEGFGKIQNPQSAFEMFQKMKKLNAEPNKITYMFLMKSLVR